MPEELVGVGRATQDAGEAAAFLKQTAYRLRTGATTMIDLPDPFSKQAG